jgi:hypothetical protein
VQALELLSGPAAAVTTAAAGNVLEKGFFKTTSTHSRMQSPRMPSAAYATLCNVVVRKQRDFGHIFVAAQRRCVARGCGRRARKRHGNQGYKTSPRSALSPLTVKRTRARDAQTPQRALDTQETRSRSGLRGAAPRKICSKADTRRPRGLCPVASRRGLAASTPCRSAFGRQPARGIKPRHRQPHH